MNVIIGFVAGLALQRIIAHVCRMHRRNCTTPTLEQVIQTNRVKYADDHKRAEENYRQAFGETGGY